MKYTITTAATVAAIAAVTLTAGCSTSPAPSNTSTAAAPSSNSSAESERAIRHEMDLNGSVGLPARVDRNAAETAAKSGVPYAFSYDWRPGACSWIRLPDQSLWSLNAGGALTRDTVSERAFRQTPGAADALSCVTTPAPIGFDAAAAEAANRHGAPYQWRTVVTATGNTCKQLVRIPGSARMFELPDEVRVVGDALDDAAPVLGCTAADAPRGGN
ncbi:hypothetical protein [Mycobacterium sp. 155]|uniref:hypothetical protein n=1 Tax=Mycobacterium sp. 155 TaxID=1157943 RepID=UPI00038015BF|nr:hypothetical protein [Mycobacterium sp. 155]